MNDRIIYNGINNPITPEEIKIIFVTYLNSKTLKRLKTYGEYYEGHNCEILARWHDRKDRKKHPNNIVPTAYYSSVVDTMSGYMFSNVCYEGETEDDLYAESLDEILEANNSGIKDMSAGVRALAFNRAFELVYTIGDGNKTEIKYTDIDPRQMFIIYDNNIDSQSICGVRFLKSDHKDYDYDIDVIYATEWQSYRYKNGSDKLVEKEPTRLLYFNQCPVVEYNAEILQDYPPFNVIIPYIDALDYVVSGNSNEIESLTDALLVIGKMLKDEDLKHMDELKALMGIKQEDRAEFITKNNDPTFRKYVSELLIQEIHKHSHVIDWYSPDSGMSGAVSAKALKTRLFDMHMYSCRIESVFSIGVRKRIDLITYVMGALSMPVGHVDIEFKRSLPDDMEDKILAIKDVTFLSDQTKNIMIGNDWKTEKERLDEQKANNPIQIGNLFKPDQVIPKQKSIDDKTITEDNTDDEQD